MEERTLVDVLVQVGETRQLLQDASTKLQELTATLREQLDTPTSLPKGPHVQPN